VSRGHGGRAKCRPYAPPFCRPPDRGFPPASLAGSPCTSLMPGPSDQEQPPWPTPSAHWPDHCLCYADAAAGLRLRQCPLYSGGYPPARLYLLLARGSLFPLRCLPPLSLVSQPAGCPAPSRLDRLIPAPMSLSLWS